MRIGIMGGTFDPVHCGHLEIARAVRVALNLDGILLLPSGDPPHKTLQTDKSDRLEMVRLAAETAGFEVSDEEIRRKGTTYTADTLKAFRKQKPDTEWVYILGADALARLGHWKKIEDLAKLCSFAVVRRPGAYDEELLDARIAELSKTIGLRFLPVDAEGPEISSTEIRARAAIGEPLDGLVPDAVADYIHRKGLYLAAMSEKAMRKKLQEEISEKRYQHTLGVVEMAERLAPRYGVDPARARLAALLHDCAKSESMKRMRKLIEKAGIEVEASELENEAVLHAPAGAAKAWIEYGVQDPEILRAIRWHTLGGPEMTPLEALIYTADCIEPGRKPYPGIEDSRALAETDIYAAARLCARQSVEYVRRRGGALHPRTLEMLNAEI